MSSSRGSEFSVVHSSTYSQRDRRAETSRRSTRSQQERGNGSTRAQQERVSESARSQQAYDEFETDVKQMASKVATFFSKAKPTSSSARRDERRRARNKSRADRMFAQSYASDAAAEPAEGAPRAALYKGEMGTRQRKSARMQKASEANPAMAKLDPRGWFSKLNLKGFPIKTVTALLCVVMLFAFLYTPAQQYYQSVRERDRLAAEYVAIEERNIALQYQNIALSSDAGMEDAVRQKYGYVKPGEEVAKVSGLSDEALDSARDSANIEANVLSSSVKAPEEWYTPYLDAFFGVK